MPEPSALPAAALSTLALLARLRARRARIGATRDAT
jgi:hypothetical protein